MSTNHTTNYNLNQWEATDKVLRTEFNEDNAKIDAALKANADALAALEDTLALKGNCQIEVQTYTGNGKSGASNPTVLTFSKVPLLVLICGYGTMMITGPQLSQCAFHSYTTNFYPQNAHISWSGSQVSLYSDAVGTGVINAANQMNEIRQAYIALAVHSPNGD